MQQDQIHVWPHLAAPSEPYVHDGDTIHVGPHVVHDMEVNTAEADIPVTTVILMGDVVVICSGKCPGPVWAVVYDINDDVPLVRAA